MNLRDLRYIVAIADLQNFTKAAEQCAVTQSTLSFQVKKLEETLGLAIFERNNKRVMLTEAGGRIVQSARRILAEADSIRETAEISRNPFVGRYRLGAFPTLASYLFPGLVPALKEAMPELRLVLVEEKSEILIEKLRSGQLDAALLALPVKDEGFEIEHLFDDPFLLAVSSDNPLAKNKAADGETLQQHRLMLLEEGHCLRDQSLSFCELIGVSDDADMRSTSLETIRQMVRADTGITLMPRIAIRQDESQIRYLPFKGEAPYRAIALVRRKTCSRAPVFQVIRECVVSQVKSINPSAEG